MRSFYCRYNENPNFPFTAGETYQGFMKQGNGYFVYDDRGNQRFLVDEPNHKFVVGHTVGITGREHPLYAEFEVYG